MGMYWKETTKYRI